MDLLDLAKDLAPTALAVVLVAVALLLVGRLFDRLERRGRSKHFTRQLTVLGLSVAGLVLVVLALPIDSGEKGNLLSLIGIVLSAGIALSSTTLLGNILAGLMIRSQRRLHAGDFVESGGRFGRVTDLGLFFTEIQAQGSSLWQLPNLVLVQNPFQVIRSQGTIVHADVSLGYDVPRGEVREALLAAAGEAGLEDPFVLVMQLGDFSVTYRCGGLLEEVKSLVSANSHLRAAMLDGLHAAGIEIVSPNFMNTRVLDPARRVMPARARSTAKDEEEDEAGVEAIAFEKADAAEVAEALKQQLARLEEERLKLAERAKLARKEHKVTKDGEADPAADLEHALQGVDRRIQRLQTLIAARASELDG